MLGSEECPRWIVEEWPNLSVNETPRRLLCHPYFKVRGPPFALLVSLPIPSKKEPQGLHPQPIGDTSGQQVTVPTSNCAIIVSATSGCLSCTMRKQSAQLAQWALFRFLWALLNPNPPTGKLKLASTLAMPGAEGEPRMVSRHVHTLASCCSAKYQGALISTKSLLGSTRT